jgi:hypothetical protein
MIPSFSMPATPLGDALDVVAGPAYGLALRSPYGDGSHKGVGLGPLATPSGNDGYLRKADLKCNAPARPLQVDFGLISASLQPSRSSFPFTARAAISVYFM